MTPRRSRTPKAGGSARQLRPSRRSIQFRPSRRTCSQPPGAQFAGQGHRVPGVLQRGVEVAEHRALRPVRRAGGLGHGRRGRGGGDGAAVRSGASHTQPCRSSTAHGIARSARGGGVPSAPSDGMSTQRPSASNRQPCAGHCRRPSVTVAVASGTSRCGQRAGKALTSPPGRSRTSTYGRSPAATGTGVVPTVGGPGHREPACRRRSPSHDPLQRRRVFAALRRSSVRAIAEYWIASGSP